MTMQERTYLDVLYNEFLQKAREASTAENSEDAAAMRSCAFLAQKIKLDFEFMEANTCEQATS